MRRQRLHALRSTAGLLCLGLTLLQTAFVEHSESKAPDQENWRKMGVQVRGRIDDVNLASADYGRRMMLTSVTLVDRDGCDKSSIISLRRTILSLNAVVQLSKCNEAY